MKSFFRKLLYHLMTLFIKREKLLFLFSDKIERELLGLKSSGYLNDIGWIRSVGTNNIVDHAGRPIPWVTYPFIAFMEGKLNRRHAIFEYGSGNSTLYYSERVASVDSVENDQLWYNKIRNEMPANANLFYKQLVYGGDYCKYSQKTGKTYDMIIVDGRDRVNCCKESIYALKPDGIIVLDDSERVEYLEGINFLTNTGFKKIDFWGMAPAVNYLKCTTLFYRGSNCLEI
ncbi:FkbM family methyltransferase [Mucilaginibacter sp. BT774]|uniref:FkbM family methyltransferase n=1 Tax=Mucilaginibacter sp. BT774 TaxID=3062276 RepID=UPI002676181E|nr:FkbM family methyltransferase [Mucilaginibacter sp. BT774]MDO3627497.1 FkbM family methyltransferase [Mucilaginibacter sp. BT774]